MRTKLLVIFLLCAAVLLSSLAGCLQKDVPLNKLAAHAVTASQLTLAGNKPFHLRASIVESTNPDSDYKATVEEFWISPTKWRRTIQSPHFSQTLIVNGDKISEQDSGDYYPFWLRDLVTAIFDPLPMAAELNRSNTSVHTPYIYGCAQQQVGSSPAQIGAFSVFCFQGWRELLESVVTPGYDAEFHDYQRFEGKLVARRIVTDPEPGTTIEATITNLEVLSNSDNNCFAVEQPTPLASRFTSARVDQTILRSAAVRAPNIIWPSVRDGKTSGAMSMYVSVDREGRVRETWPLNSDNARLDDAARAQVMKWRFRPIVQNGVPVQAESIFTLAFSTKIVDPVPTLSDAEARKLVQEIIEPSFTPDAAKPGTTFIVPIHVGADGKLISLENKRIPDSLFFPAYHALEKWRFKPYIHNGKPDEFKADITFRVP